MPKEPTPYFDFKDVQNDITDIIIDKVDDFLDLEDEQYMKLETVMSKSEIQDIIIQFIEQMNFKLKTSNII